MRYPSGCPSSSYWLGGFVRWGFCLLKPLGSRAPWGPCVWEGSRLLIFIIKHDEKSSKLYSLSSSWLQLWVFKACSLRPWCLEALGLEGFSPEATYAWVGSLFCVFCSTASIKICLASLIVDGLLFEVIGMKRFLVEVRVIEKTGVVHFDWHERMKNNL